MWNVKEATKTNLIARSYSRNAFGSPSSDDNSASCRKLSRPLGKSHRGWRTTRVIQVLALTGLGDTHLSCAWSMWSDGLSEIVITVWDTPDCPAPAPNIVLGILQKYLAEYRKSGPGCGRIEHNGCVCGQWISDLIRERNYLKFYIWDGCRVSYRERNRALQPLLQNRRRNNWQAKYQTFSCRIKYLIMYDLTLNELYL